MIFGERTTSLAALVVLLLASSDTAAAARSARGGGKRNVRTRKLSKSSSKGETMGRADDFVHVADNDVEVISTRAEGNETETLPFIVDHQPPLVPPSSAPTTSTDVPHSVPTYTSTDAPPDAGNTTDVAAEAENNADDNDSTSTYVLPSHPLDIIAENIIDDGDDAQEAVSDAEKVDQLFDEYDTDSNGLLDRDEFIATIDDTGNSTPPDESVTPPPAPPKNSPTSTDKDHKPPVPADKNRVSTFGEEFQLSNGVYVSCNWPARRRPERRCAEITAGGRLVMDVCPEACASVAVKDSKSDDKDEPDEPNKPKYGEDDGLRV